MAKDAESAAGKLRAAFGTNLRRCRKATGISQEKFSEKIGVARSYVSEIETGRKFPSADVMERICSILGVPIHVLFLREKDSKPIEINELIGEIRDDLLLDVQELIQERFDMLQAALQLQSDDRG